MAKYKLGKMELKLKVPDEKVLMPCLYRLTYTEAVGELDGMTATFKIPITEREKIKAASLYPGAEFELELMEEKSKLLKRNGDIIAVSFEQSRDMLLVVLVGVNYLHRLRNKHETFVWEKSHSDIVKAIAGRAKPSLKAVVQGVTTTADYTFQQNETDALFLMRLAREHNYLCRVVGKELHFSRRDMNYGKAVKLNSVTDIFSLRLTANLKDHLNEVNVYWGDYEKDGTKFTKVKYKTKPKALNSGGKLGCDLGKTKFGSKVLTIGGYDSPLYKNQSEAKAKAKAELDAAASDFVEGVATCRSVPGAACGAKLTIEEAGWPFEGNFIITKVFHEAGQDGRILKSEITFKANSLPKE